jgi:hypothetical protein
MPTPSPDAASTPAPIPNAGPVPNGGPPPNVDGTERKPRSPADAPVTAPAPRGPELSDDGEGSGVALEPIPQPVPVGPAPDRPAPTPVALGPLDFLGGVVTGAIGNVGLIIRPDAALAVATEFTFPLALAVAVLLFLVVQDQVDRRDPKLRAAPQRQSDTFIHFEPEETA